MVCRSNPASSVVIALARDGTWLDDAQVQSIFHRLRHDPVDGGPHMTNSRREETLDRVFTRARGQIDTNPALRPQRRQGLRDRLERSRAQVSRGQLGDDTLFAMSRLEAGVHAAQRATEARLYELAGRLGMSGREVRAEFVRLRAEAPSGRQARARPEDLAEAGNIPSDPATRHALHKLSTRSPERPPVRLVQRWVPVRDVPHLNSGDTNLVAEWDTAHDWVDEVGYSDLSNRVELRQRSGRLQARAVPPEWRDSFARTLVRDRPTLQTVDDINFMTNPVERVEQTAYAVRCDDCGQFIGDRTHTCPVANATWIRQPPTAHTTANGAMLCASPAETINAAVTENAREPVAVEITYSRPDQAAVVTGRLSVRPGDQVITDPERRGRQILDVDDSGPGDLQCSSCGDGSCAHANQARQAVRQHLASLGQITPPERLAAVTEAVTEVQVRERAEAPAETAGEDAVPVSFLSDPEAFRSLIRDAGEDREVPFGTDNVLHGYAAGRRFGVEMEFNAPDYATSGRIADQLAAAGIIDSPVRHYYHHTETTGGYDSPYWGLESDCTVPMGGELVSNICSDNPDDWGRFEQACRIIQSNGGTTHDAGSHTNISCEGFTVSQAWRLVRMFRTFEDDLQRMGRTPGSRRDRLWAAPFPDPGPQPWDDHTRPALLWARGQMVNFNHAFTDDSRLEYRFPDASHNAGVIQGQVKLAAALTGYVRDHDVPDGITARPIGSARREGWANHLMRSTPDEWETRTRPVRTLIDTLFSRGEDRRQIALLWAHGRYITPSAGR